MTKIARKFITNAAGPYALAAGVGFGMGQASQRSGGKPPTLGQTIYETSQALPLPSVDFFTDTADWINRLLDEDKTTKSSMGKWPPRWTIPAGIWEAKEGISPKEQQLKMPKLDDLEFLKSLDLPKPYRRP